MSYGRQSPIVSTLVVDPTFEMPRPVWRHCLRAGTRHALSGRIFEVFNPSIGEVLAELPDMGVEETHAATEKAHALKHNWIDPDFALALSLMTTVVELQKLGLRAHSPVEGLGLLRTQWIFHNRTHTLPCVRIDCRDKSSLSAYHLRVDNISADRSRSRCASACCLT